MNTKPATYRIVRFFERGARQTRGLPRGLTLAEAREHCADINTSSKTAWTTSALKRTSKRGPWFDGFQQEGETC